MKLEKDRVSWAHISKDKFKDLVIKMVLIRQDDFVPYDPKSRRQEKSIKDDSAKNLFFVEINQSLLVHRSINLEKLMREKKLYWNISCLALELSTGERSSRRV